MYSAKSHSVSRLSRLAAAAGVILATEEYELTFQYRVSRMSVPSSRLNHM